MLNVDHDANLSALKSAFYNLHNTFSGADCQPPPLFCLVIKGVLRTSSSVRSFGLWSLFSDVLLDLTSFYTRCDGRVKILKRRADLRSWFQ